MDLKNCVATRFGINFNPPISDQTAFYMKPIQSFEHSVNDCPRARKNS